MARAKKTTTAKVMEQVKEVKDAAVQAGKEMKEAAVTAAKEVKADETVEKAAAKVDAAVEKVEKAVKKAATKKSVKETVFVQYLGSEFDVEDLKKMVKEACVNEHKMKVSEIASMTLYVKPEEMAVYYVVNEGVTGKVQL
ncbi:MAG: DUF6465 family protein [Eubacteriales bacterium]|nr:DUF6465 family protein [Eubacteriales bacterium]